MPQPKALRRVAEGMGAITRGDTHAHIHLRQHLANIAVVSILVDLISSVVVLLFERHADNTQIHNLGDSLFWTTTQLLTVSSQLPNPISTGGRIFDVFLQIYAITVVATLAGAFGAFFNRRSLERQPLSRSSPPAR